MVLAPAMEACVAELHGQWSRDEPPSTDEERALVASFGMDSD